MARISSDIPPFIMNILSAVDYSRITDSDYDGWLRLIKHNIGNHLKLRRGSCSFIELSYPLRQDLCDLINGYDFRSLSLLKQSLVVPLVLRWCRANLPLIRDI